MMVIPSNRKIAKTYIKNIKRKFFHNGLIQAISVSFMKTVTAGIGHTLQLWIIDEVVSTGRKINFVLISLIILWILIWSFMTLLRNRNRLNEKYPTRKVGKLYTEINTKSKFGIFFFPIFFSKI